MQKNNPPKIIYLVQGRAREFSQVSKIFAGREIKYLSWDERIAGAYYLPNSTWSAGRRYLLSKIITRDYDYIGLVDGDIKIISGSLDSFEKKIFLFKPAIAVPLFDKNRSEYRGGLRDYNTAITFNTDEQFQVFNSSLMRNVFINDPYISKFDEISWWYPCVLMQAFTSRNLWRYRLTDLDFNVKNLNAGKYTNSYDSNYIHLYMKDRGLSSYLPLISNGKELSYGFARRSIYRLIDTLLRSLSVRMFPLLSKPFDESFQVGVLKKKWEKMVS